MPQPVALVVGASRGIGRQIALTLAAAGYRVAVAAKTSTPASELSSMTPFPPDPNSPQSTIDTVAREIHNAGGTALPVAVDVRSEPSIAGMISSVISTYGALDVLVYNSGAIWWSSVENSPPKRFRLMQQVNPEGLYATLHACLPQFKAQGWRGRVVVVSPPIYSRFFRGKTAYAMGKVGMSVLTKGLAMDWVREGKSEMAITSIWPAAAIQSGATREMQGDARRELRTPEIFADAVLEIVRSASAEVSGELVLDEDFLRDKGVVDFGKYSLVPGAAPRRIMPARLPDLTVAEQDDEGRRMDSAKARGEKAKI